MRCPKCTQEGFQPYATCTKCGFSGAPGPVEELGHVAYLLGEIDTWREVGTTARRLLRGRYLRRREQLELDLGLRPPPLSAEKARKLQWEVYCLDHLQAEVSLWLAQNWVHTDSGARLIQGAQKRAQVLGERLAVAPPAPAFDSLRDQLNLFDYLAGILGQAAQRGHFVDDVSRAAAQAQLQARRAEIEIAVGLRPRPVEAAPPVRSLAPLPKPAKPSRPPREPFTWDRIWQTLLSERTLNVLLFLGAFLLVASAATYVVYNWETLPPAVQLGFIALFTLSFYGAGWFLRVRMKLRASSIAVTAIGSLLVPLDFYAVGIAGGVVPAEQWPWVWLVASLVCLPIYTFTAIRIQAGFFGYTVAVAAGSLVCAALQVVGLPPEWFLTALAATALGLAVVAYRLQAASPPSPTDSQSAPSPPEGEGVRSSWTVLSRPFRFASLIAAAVVLPLGIGWWLVGGASGFDFDTSLALSWALGAVLFVYAALRERSPLLGRAAATTLPLALGLLLRLAFETLGVETPWYALVGALLAPVYVWAGQRWLAPPQSPPPAGGKPGVLRAHGRTATGWGLALMAIAAGWAVFDLWAAAVTHALLVLSVVLAVRLWQRPRALPVASLLAFSSLTFGMAAGHLAPAELCLGWALLAVLQQLVALRLPRAPEYAARLYAAALVVALLALLPPLVFRHEPLLTYVLGHWIGLSLWLLWLDQRGEHAGLTALLTRFDSLRHSALHWAVALPLPFFATMLYTRSRPVDGWLGLVLALLAWICFGIGKSGIRQSGSWSLVFRRWSFPWHVVAYGCSVAGPLVAFYAWDRPLLGVTILLASALYFVSAWAFRADQWLIPGGLALPLGLFVLLSYWQVGWPEQSVAYAAVVAAYLLVGTWLEQFGFAHCKLGRGVAGEFMASLYAVAHLLAVVALGFGLAPAFDSPWTDAARLWAAGGQLVLAVAYGLFAWFRQRERWAHVAVWLGVLAGGLVASAYSQGRGSSAFKVALLAVAYVLAERALISRAVRQRWSAAERAWSLYRRPLLVAGWAVSAGAIGLALVRNLVLLGGGYTREVWAIAGLLTVTALYAASTWMYERRLFAWLAGALVIVPWTLLAAWGWFVWAAPPPLPRYALSWAVLACLQLALGILLTPPLPSPPQAGGKPGPPPRPTGGIEGGQDYGYPLRVLANLLLPFALFWGVADVGTSVLTWGLGLAFYVASAAADHRRGLGGWRAARFFYPAVAVLPVWAVYLLNHFLPTAPYETYGLLLLALALPLLGVGRWLRRFDAADGLPLYLGAYGVAAVGTLLVAHVQPLLALALTFDALLCLLSAWIFREAVWGFPAAALGAAALLSALAASERVPPERRGWWLIGLGAIYLALALRLRSGQAWVLRRGRLRRADLRAYSTAPLAMAFLVTALGLPPSSLDDTGAFWGYLAAAVLYALAAAWLRQPLLLAATAGLLAVPYGVGLVWLEVTPLDYGLAIFPGVAAALALAHLLDWLAGRVWKPGLRDSIPGLPDWWGGPFYAWGYVGALVAGGLSWNDSTRLAIALGLAALTFLHATVRFRSRAFLLLAGALAQASALAVIDVVGWLEHPAWAALAFLPVTAATAGVGLVVERLRGEGPPLAAGIGESGNRGIGWSRVFYLLLAVDLVGGQVAALFGAEPGAAVTVGHGLLLALLATVWAQPVLPFVAAGLGVVGLFQGLAWAGAEVTGYPVGLALLALGYGLVGYALRFVWGVVRRGRIWFKPLEWSALGLSALALLLAVGVGGLDVSRLLVRTLLGRAVTVAAYAPELRMVMWVLALSGLLYLATAVVRRWTVLGYGAVALLLAAWGLWWRFFVDMPGFQWYAVPAGAYLLGIGWSEGRRPAPATPFGRGWRRALARWIDRAGMLVWLGSAWWQSLPGVMPNGWPYALLMGAEGLLLVWWGSARRLRRFLYLGAAAVALSAVTQAIEPLLSANRWIVFGIVGSLLVGVAILVERNLNKIRELSAEMRGRLEGWE